MHYVRLAQQNIIGMSNLMSTFRSQKMFKYFNCNEGNMWVSKNDCEAKDHLQKPDFLWIISGSSWYSSAETHIFLKVLRPANIEPPIHVEYFRSGGA